MQKEYILIYCIKICNKNCNKIDHTYWYYCNYR